MGIIMQIVFKNIELVDSKDSFWGISYDGWFTGLTPVLLFICGYIIAKKIENNKEKKRLNNLEKYFRKNIDFLQVLVTKQINAFVKFANDLKETKK